LNTSLGVTSREWVIAFWILIGVVLVAALGFSTKAALAILIIVVLTMLASRACAHPKLSYLNSLRVVASINPTGETLIGQIFVLPALVVATGFSWFLGLTWLLGGREWPRKRWLAFLRRYQSLARRVTLRDQ
jgi:hypothetical protein